MSDAWQRELEGRVQKLETADAVLEVHNKNVERRLGDIENGVTWLIRIVVGGMVVAAVAYAMNGGLVL